jgi:hypothetical protein
LFIYGLNNIKVGKDYYEKRNTSIIYEKKSMYSGKIPILLPLKMF